MVLLSVPTFTLDPMVVPRALVLSLSNLLMMLVTQSNSSMATIGKVVLLRSEKTDSLLQVDLEVVVDSELVEALEEALVVVVASNLEVALVAALGAAVVVMEEALGVERQVDLMEELVQSPQFPILSPTMLLLALTEARLSTSEM